MINAIIDEYIKNKGIIKCVNLAKEVYYLDIEEHILYTEKEMLVLAFNERKWERGRENKYD